MFAPKSRWLIPMHKLADDTMVGFVNDEELSWHNHIDHIKRKCFSALSTLRRYKDVMPAGMQRRFFVALQKHLELLVFLQNLLNVATCCLLHQ